MSRQKRKTTNNHAPAPYPLELALLYDEAFLSRSTESVLSSIQNFLRASDEQKALANLPHAKRTYAPRRWGCRTK